MVHQLLILHKLFLKAHIRPIWAQGEVEYFRILKIYSLSITHCTVYCSTVKLYLYSSSYAYANEALKYLKAPNLLLIASLFLSLSLSLSCVCVCVLALYCRVQNIRAVFTMGQGGNCPPVFWCYLLPPPVGPVPITAVACI